MDELKMPEELTEELARLRKKDKLFTWILTGILGVGLIGGSWMYTQQKSYAGETNNVTPAVYSANSISAPSTGGSAVGGSSTGGSSSAGGGGCCGGGSSGGAATKTDLASLEKQALEKEVAQFGDQQATAKATDYGCHVQIDIYNASKKIIHSYAFRGGQLNLIQ